MTGPPSDRRQPITDGAITPTRRARWREHGARLARAGRALLGAARQALVRARTRFGRNRSTVGPSTLAGADTVAAAATNADAQYPSAAPPTTDGRFSEYRFGDDAQRRYVLYEPPPRRVRAPAPLLVLLHGCGQGAEDFAAGTRMNEAAEEAGVLVLYPEQSRAANVLRCWNWYALQDRSNPKGDAALIVAMTRQVMAEHDIDAARVYVGGMSAGGGMAAILARDYPELFAALGVHSGVPAGLAHDVFSAMRVLSGGPEAGGADAAPPAFGVGQDAAVPSIIFHGDQDTMVHPSNGEAFHAMPGARTPDSTEPSPSASQQIVTAPSAGQHGFTRTVDLGPGGVTRRELWIIHGAGHAWAGGSDSERHTDANGPNASREMLRFFLQHRLGGTTAPLDDERIRLGSAAHGEAYGS